MALALACLSVACGASVGGPSAQGAGAAAALRPSAVEELQRGLARQFSAPEVERVLWGITIRSLKTGRAIFERNPRLSLMPASNMKIVTLSAAAERLGWDYRFETTIVATAPIEDGVLRGELVIVGGGDPSLNNRSDHGARLLAGWADALWSNGLRRIEGSIVGDDDAFDDEVIGDGWSWDYLAYDYAAPVGALQYNENVEEIEIAPGEAAGAPARVTLRGGDGDVRIESFVTTAAADAKPQITLARPPPSKITVVTGRIPVGAKPLVEGVAVSNPTEHVARSLRAALVARGIEVTGGARDIDDVGRERLKMGGPTLIVHRSPPLSEIATLLMKVSHNLYAETLLKTLGRRDAAPGTAAAGRRAVASVLASWGVPDGSYVIADGSGLSRYNYVTADMIATVLARMYKDPRHHDAWLATLPIAGRDGTLARRMKGTRAEGNVRAKTGTIANVRSLSGYVDTADGEPIVFSMIANNFTGSRQAVDATVERALELVASARGLAASR